MFNLLHSRFDYNITAGIFSTAVIFSYFWYMGVIYKITSPSGRVYVGQTINWPKRLGDYSRCGRYKHDSIIHNSIKKYGYENHCFEIIEEVDNESLSEREIYWIAELNTYWKDGNGMNMTNGGESGSGSWIHDIERRKKQSKRFTGEGNPFYGKNHSKEFLEKKSKEVSEYNKRVGIKIPEWGAKKGLEARRRKIICYDLNGNFFKEFNSLSQIESELDINHASVSNNCSGKITNAGGYVFKYKTENYPQKIEIKEIKNKSIKRPVLTLNSDYEIVCEHPSAAEASEFWGIPKTTINRAAMYNWLVPIRSGHVFIYTDLYSKILAAEQAA